jgi:hypothetical protein
MGDMCGRARGGLGLMTALGVLGEVATLGGGVSLNVM